MHSSCNWSGSRSSESKNGRVDPHAPRHLDRSEAQWRDLLFNPHPTSVILNEVKDLQSVRSTTKTEKASDRNHRPSSLL
jgi:hypothetical protein